MDLAQEVAMVVVAMVVKVALVVVAQSEKDHPLHAVRTFQYEYMDVLYYEWVLKA